MADNTSSNLGPRVVIAGTHSGVGKTTVATGLMAAFRRRGVSVASVKVGPDFIDPSFHAAATGRVARNVDPWICGEEAIGPLATRAARDAQLLIVEGVMGLFDGAADGSCSSTADIAERLEAPVVLVVDGSSMSASVAALVRGFRDHNPNLVLAGVILNRVRSARHEALLTESLEALPIPVLGSLKVDEDFVWRDRHLGLVPVAENPHHVASSIEVLAQAIEQSCRLSDIESVATSASVQRHREPTTAASQLGQDRSPVRVGVAGGPAFTFTYQDNLEQLVSAGAEIVGFDPLEIENLPSDLDGLIIGGGFPEVFATRLLENQLLASDVRSQVGSGLPTWAECGGLLWLCASIDDKPSVGIVRADAAMGTRLTLGYRNAVVRKANPVAKVGAELKGHEFHYSTIDPGGDALALSSRFGSRVEGFASTSLLATYLHQHLGDNPGPAEHFVRACLAARSSKSSLG